MSNPREIIHSNSTPEKALEKTSQQMFPNPPLQIRHTTCHDPINT